MKRNSIKKPLTQDEISKVWNGIKVQYKKS